LNAAKIKILLLWLLIVTSLGNASATTPGATENRVWQKSLATVETRQVEPLQTLGRHQENEGAGYDFASDSLLAAKTGALRIAPYEELSGNVAGQAHHLNQTAAYRDIIPRKQGLSIELEGNIFTDAGAPHTLAHGSLEGFWNKFRGTDIVPTNLEYTRAAQQSLRAAGLSEVEVQQAIQAAIRERVQAGALGGMEVPRVPGPIRNLAR